MHTSKNLFLLLRLKPVLISLLFAMRRGTEEALKRIRLQREGKIRPIDSYTVS